MNAPFDWDAWSRRAAHDYGPMDPWEITEADFYSLLGCMPPARHRVMQSYEWFHLIELLRDDTATWAARIGPWEGGGLYIRFQASMLSREEHLIAILEKAKADKAAGHLPQAKPEYRE